MGVLNQRDSFGLIVSGPSLFPASRPVKLVNSWPEA
jgi:hypothetical protein